MSSVTAPAAGDMDMDGILDSVDSSVTALPKMDMDMDGILDSVDSSITPAYLTMDMDMDGILDFGDPVLTSMPSMGVPDVDMDGIVDTADPRIVGDMDMDGVADSVDTEFNPISMIGPNPGPSPDSTSTPGPSPDPTTTPDPNDHDPAAMMMDMMMDMDMMMMDMMMMDMDMDMMMMNMDMDMMMMPGMGGTPGGGMGMMMMDMDMMMSSMSTMTASMKMLMDDMDMMMMTMPMGMDALMAMSADMDMMKSDIASMTAGMSSMASNMGMTAKPSVVSAKASVSVPSYGTTVRISGKVALASGTPLAGMPVDLKTAAGTVVAKSITATDGTYAFNVKPRSKTTYQVSSRNSLTVIGAQSASVTVTPKALLTRPSSPTTAYLNRVFISEGYIKPRHVAGTFPVTIKAYRRISGKWVLKKTIKAKASNYSTYSKYSVRYSLPSRGYWKLVAFHSDSGHAATTSTGRYLTVK